MNIKSIYEFLQIPYFVSCFISHSACSYIFENTKETGVGTTASVVCYTYTYCHNNSTGVKIKQVVKQLKRNNNSKINHQEQI